MLLIRGGERLAAGAPAVRGPLYVGIVLLVLTIAYWPTVRELSGFGTRTDGQFLIVFCAFAGLVWSRRHELEVIPIQPSWLGLAALQALAIAWLLGQIAFVRLVTDVSVVFMVPAAILAVCGVQWVKALAFPLAFLALAIPLEQPIAPPLAEWTAEATIFMLKFVGIAVEREGAYFTIPTGSWVVADACGGVKYLTSCLIVALLLAPVLFTSVRKRAAFVLGALTLAIVGNWIRAFLTVLGAHLSNNQILRDDHSTFGWLVYAALFVLYLAAWWRLRDEPSASAEPVCGEFPRIPAPFPRGAPMFALAAIAIALSAPLVNSATSAQRGAQAPGNPQIPEAHGWLRADRSATPWRPKLQNATVETLYSFTKDGRTVDLFIGLFHEEDWDAKLISVANRFVEPGTQWALASRGIAATRFAGRDFTVTRAVIAGAHSRIVAWQWYWVDGATTGSRIEAKLAQVRSRLTSGRQQSAWIAVSASLDIPPGADNDLQAFVAENGAAIDRALAAAFGESRH